jgi:hypothetical protein
VIYDFVSIISALHAHFLLFALLPHPDLLAL